MFFLARQLNLKICFPLLDLVESCPSFFATNGLNVVMINVVVIRCSV